MRVLCATTAGDGHFGPLAHVARACVNAGHDVLVAAPASYANAVNRAGLQHAPFEDVPRAKVAAVMAGLPHLGGDRADETVVRELFGRLDAQHALPGVRALVEQWRPDVVLREPVEFASLACAEAAGIPHVEVSAGLAAAMEWARARLAEPLAELDALAALPEGRLLTAAGASPAFTTVPASLDEAGTAGSEPPSTREVIRYRVPTATGTGRLPPAWGDPADPLVYLTFGTVAGALGHLKGLFAATLAALADLPIRVLLTTGHAGGVHVATPWPANAHVERFWPQDDVMPHTAVVVGHGGFGTTMTAAAAGVPQVLLPLFTVDQRLNAERIAAVGAGVRIEGGPEGVGEVADAVPRVLADARIRERAHELAADIAGLPEASALVPAVERIARRGAGA